MKTKDLTRMALLTAIALTIFMVELQLPGLSPVPGIKLGLSNIVTVWAVFTMGPKKAALILSARVFLGAVFSGQMSTILYSGAGGACVCQQGQQKLVDRTGAEFPIIKDGRSCRSVLLNGKKLNIMDRREDLSRLGLWGLRLYFTTENTREVDRVLRDFVNGAPFEPGSCTRGLYLRGLD